MKKIVGLIFALMSLCAHAQQQQLSTRAAISLITCGPGQSEVFLAFGHSAIRVYDPENGIDYVYNYGVFDFNQPNFYINYTRGLLLFKLGVYLYPDFLNAYIEDNRWVHEQVLDLTPTQAQAIFNYLEWNALPENQTYRYDYFYNNCSSKVRDVFADVLGDSLRFDGAYITTTYTIRQLTDLYLTQQPWGDLGIDICLGLPMDKKATPYEYMFLPDYLESGFDHATIRGKDAWVPLVKSKQPFYPLRPGMVSKSPVHPWVALGGLLLAAIALSVYDVRSKRVSKWFDIMLFGLTGLVGTLLVLLWTVTDHQAAANNFNLLWALPPHLVVFVIYREKSAPFLKKYFRIVTFLMAFLLLIWFFLPQQLHFFLLPFVTALMVRAYLLYRKL